MGRHRHTAKRKNPSKNKSLQKQERPGKMIQFLEVLTSVAIVLVLIQTFLEDLALFLNWNPTAVFAIKVAAVGFDLFFTIEFFSRMTSALKRRAGKAYFFANKGWIDLVASLPLLILVSGPYLLQVTTGISLAGLIAGAAGSGRALKVLKAIKVTRILRFVRMLKIFGKIKNVQSPMAQRHISKICTITVFSLTFFFISFSLIESAGLVPGSSNQTRKTEQAITNRIVESDQYMGSIAAGDYLRKLFADHENVLYYENKGTILINRVNGSPNATSPIALDRERVAQLNLREIDDLAEVHLSNGSVLLFSRQSELKSASLTGMINFSLILFMMVIILLFYSPHFARTVTDPIFVMRKGFEKRNYTLAVKIPKKHADDDIFKLAEDYNDRWLPAKLRRLHSSTTEKPKLTLDDILKGPALD